MRANPLDNNDGRLVGNKNFKTVIIALDVEYDPVLCQKACGGITIPDLLRHIPNGHVRIGEPVFDPPSRVCVLGAKRLELVTPDDSHVRSASEQSLPAWFPFWELIWDRQHLALP
jgi:hypothetical protein